MSNLNNDPLVLQPHLIKRVLAELGFPVLLAELKEGYQLRLSLSPKRFRKRFKGGLVSLRFWKRFTPSRMASQLYFSSLIEVLEEVPAVKDGLSLSLRFWKKFTPSRMASPLYSSSLIGPGEHDLVIVAHSEGLDCS